MVFNCSEVGHRTWAGSGMFQLAREVNADKYSGPGCEILTYHPGMGRDTCKEALGKVAAGFAQLPTSEYLQHVCPPRIWRLQEHMVISASAWSGFHIIL